MAEKGWPSLFKGFRPEHCQKPISNSLCFIKSLIFDDQDQRSVLLSQNDKLEASLTVFKEMYLNKDYCVLANLRQLGQNS